MHGCMPHPDGSRLVLQGQTPASDESPDPNRDPVLFQMGKVRHSDHADPTHGLMYNAEHANGVHVSNR